MPPLQRPPELHEAARIAHLDIHDIVKDRRCRRHLPKSSRDLCVQASLYLLELAEKREEEDMRQAALTLLTVAPQLLWPEPPKVKGKRRAPYARERLTRLRCTMLLRGEWLRLLELPDEQTIAPPATSEHERSDEDRLAYALNHYSTPRKWIRISCSIFWNPNHWIRQFAISMEAHPLMC